MAAGWVIEPQVIDPEIEQSASKLIYCCCSQQGAEQGLLPMPWVGRECHHGQGEGWACSSTPDSKLNRGTTAKLLLPSPRRSQQIWDLFAPCTALPEGCEGNLSPWCLLSLSLSVHLDAVPKWKKALFLFTTSALSWPWLCTKA